MGKNVINSFKKYFVTGLLVLVPATLTAFIIFETLNRIDKIIPYKMLGIQRIPGLGVLTLILIIFFTGLIARNFIGRRMLATGDKIVAKIPIISRIYEAFKQISHAIFSEKRELFKKVVLIEYPRKGIYSIGFFTQDTRGVVQNMVSEDVVSVFLPTTPNPTSGYLLFVPKKEAIELDMTIEDAMKLIISGGAIMPESSKIPKQIGMQTQIDTVDQKSKVRA